MPGMSKVSLIAGLIALALSAVPLTGAGLAFPPFVVSIVCGTIALRRQPGNRAAIAGLVLCGLAVLVALVVMPRVVQMA